MLDERMRRSLDGIALLLSSEREILADQNETRNTDPAESGVAPPPPPTSTTKAAHGCVAASESHKLIACLHSQSEAALGGWRAVAASSRALAARWMVIGSRLHAPSARVVRGAPRRAAPGPPSHIGWRPPSRGLGWGRKRLLRGLPARRR